MKYNWSEKHMIVPRPRADSEILPPLSKRHAAKTKQIKIESCCDHNNEPNKSRATANSSWRDELPKYFCLRNKLKWKTNSTTSRVSIAAKIWTCDATRWFIYFNSISSFHLLDCDSLFSYLLDDTWRCLCKSRIKSTHSTLV